MHELAICQALVRRIENLAAEHEGESLQRVVLLVGPLSGAEPELIKHAFPLAAAGSAAANAALDIDISPVEVFCRQCGTTTTSTAGNLTCSNCGAWRTELIAGDELVLQRLEFKRVILH